jgi:hypothetical protein
MHKVITRVCKNVELEATSDRLGRYELLEQVLPLVPDHCLIKRKFLPRAVYEFRYPVEVSNEISHHLHLIICCLQGIIEDELVKLSVPLSWHYRTC